jgi:hypothetical protein
MNVGDFLNELKRYEEEIDGIRSRFVRTSQEIHIGCGDDALLRQYLRELIHLFRDALGPNDYSGQIGADFKLCRFELA